VTTASNPRLLLLETSGRAGWVALAHGDTLRAVRRLDEARRHARDLAPAVRDMLTAENWKPRDVEAVLVGRGPGSYTGLRVGLISAKAFAYATGCALIAVDTFAAIAAQTPEEALAVDVLADAQQDKVYIQGFVRPQRGDSFAPSMPLTIEPFAIWLQRREVTAWASGPGLAVTGRRLPDRVPVVAAARWFPLPESVLALGIQRYRAGERDDIWSVEPLYLRPSSAEEKWQQRSQL
jgi:tRNA threonylcarbamoyladenosine biosynthesis protein TsaB